MANDSDAGCLTVVILVILLAFLFEHLDRGITVLIDGQPHLLQIKPSGAK